MRELIKKLYIVSGEQSGRITRMLIFNTLKSFFESFMLGGILFLLMKICENIFDGKMVTMNDVYMVAVIEMIGIIGKIILNNSKN